MNPRPDAVSLLRTYRPEHRDTAFDPDGPVAVACLEQILAQSPAISSLPTQRRRRARRLAVPMGAATVAAGAALALSTFVNQSPDVVARAAAALNQPDTILHFVARTGDHTLEVWQTAGGRQERTIYDGGLESVEDWDTETSMSYSAERDEIIRHTEPGFFDSDQRLSPGIDAPTPLASGNIADDLARLLDRARHGDDSVHLVGETTVRDIPVYELRIDYTVRMVDVQPGETANAGRTRAVELSRVVYVDRERFLPVRVVENPSGPRGRQMITEYIKAERLPRTPENERLLKMSPHPGAREIVEGRF